MTAGGYDNFWMTQHNWLTYPGGGTPGDYPDAPGDTARFVNNGGGDHAPYWSGGGNHLELQWLRFETADCAAYTISAQDGSSNNLIISAGGGVSVDSDVTTDQTINMVLRPENGTTTYTNDGEGLLNFNGGMQAFWATPTNAIAQFDGIGDIQAGALEDRDEDRTMSVIKNGGGTLTLNGANTLSGLVSVNEGTLAITGTGTGSSTFGNQLRVGYDAGDTAALTISGGTTTVAGDLRLGEYGAGTITQTGGTINVDRLVSGRYSGGTGIYNMSDGILNVAGNGWATLEGTGTFAQTGGAVTIGGTYYVTHGTLSDGKTGTLNLNGGTFTTNGLAEGNGTAVVTMAGGTLRAGGSFATPVDITLNAPGGTFDSNGNTLTLDGNLDGDGTLTKTGAAMMTLTGANTYTGATTVSEGTLEIAGTGKLYNGGQPTAPTTVSVASGAQIVLSGGPSQHNVLGFGVNETWIVAGTINSTGGSAQTLPGNVTLNNGTLTGVVNNSFGTYHNSGSAVITANGSGNTISDANIGLATTLTLTTPQPDDALAVSSVLFSGSGLTKTGAGTVTLTGANTYTGSTTVSEGTLQIGNGGGTGTLGNNSDTSVASGATLVIDRDAGINRGYTYSGALSGSGTVDIASGSRLNFETNNQTASGNLTFNVDGTLGLESVTGVTEVHLGELTGNGLVARGNTASGSTTVVIGGKDTDSTFSGNIGSDEISIAKVGSGTFTLSGANTFGGTTAIEAGTLRLGHVSALSSTSAITMAGGTTLAKETGSDTTISAPITLGASGTATFNLNDAGGGGVVEQLILDSGISGGGNITFISSASDNTYSTVVLNGQSSYGGSTLLDCADIPGFTYNNDNIFVELGIENALPTTTVVTLDGGHGSGSGRKAVLDLNGNNQTLAGLTNVDRNKRNQIVRNTGATDATLTINNDSNYTFSGELGTGGENFGLTKGGGSTFTLSGTNSFTGATSVSSGTLKIADSGTLGAGDYSANISIASGATFEHASSASQTLGGGISGGGALTKSGSGTLTLSGDNSYSGLTTVQAGVLRITSNKALGAGGGSSYTHVPGNTATGRVELAGGITTNEAFVLRMRQDAAVDSPHLSNISGSNVINGIVYGAAGGLYVNIESQAGNLDLAGGLRFIWNDGERRFRLMGDGDGEVSGSILNGEATNLHVIKEGAGTWTLSGANTYTGTTTVNNGVLEVNGTHHDGSGGSVGAYTIGPNGTLSGTATITAPVTIEGTLAPGQSPGGMTFEDTLTINGTFAVEIGNHNDNAGDNYDQVIVTTENGLTIGPSGSLYATNWLGSWDLHETGTWYPILGYTGDIQGSGAFASLFGVYDIDYAYDIGDSYTWIAIMVPEPASLGLLSLGLLFVGRRRRWTKNSGRLYQAC